MLYVSHYEVMIWRDPDVSRPEVRCIDATATRSEAFTLAHEIVAEIGEVWSWSLHEIDSRNAFPLRIADETGWIVRSNSAREGVRS